jgi:hypothetical protein
MRSRRSEGIPIPKGEKKLVGRPAGWRKENGVFTTIRVTENLKDVLNVEHKPGERFSDTIERILYERAQTIQALRKENDRLKLLVDSR